VSEAKGGGEIFLDGVDALDEPILDLVGAEVVFFFLGLFLGLEELLEGLFLLGDPFLEGGDDLVALLELLEDDVSVHLHLLKVLQIRPLLALVHFFQVLSEFEFVIDLF